MVFLKDVSGNADAGTAQKWGGNQISLIDNLFDNVDISASIVNGTGKVRMATAWYFRSGKLELRNPADTFSYIFTGSAITANRTITVPLITGNANMVLDAINNTFLATQEIQVNSNDPFTLYKPINTSLTTWDLNWDANDSAGNKTTYADARAQIIDNTDTSEDGRFSINVIIGGTKREVFRLQSNNCTIYNAQSNANGTNTQLEFLGLDSGSTEHAYAMIRSEIVDNTGGSEDGRLEFLVSVGGTLTETLLIHDNGDVDMLRGGLDILDDGNADLLDLERTDNGVGNQNGINFWLEDSTNALTQYGRIHTEIQDATNGSEDGQINLGMIRAGTFRNDVFKFDQGGYMYMKRYSSTDFDEIGIIFNALDNGSAEQQYGAFSMELMDTVAGSEDGQFDWDVVRAGTIQRVMKLDNVGGLKIGRDTSNMRGVVSCYRTDTTNQFFSNTTSEQTLFSFTVKGNTVGIDGQITVKMAGYLHQDQATGTTFTIRIKVGGTTWYSDAFGGTIAQSSNSRVWRAELCFYPDNQSSTNGRLDGYFMMNDTALPTTGIGSIGDDEVHVNAPIRSSGTNAWGSGFGSDTTISATIQMSVANANVMFEMEKLSIVLDPT